MAGSYDEGGGGTARTRCSQGERCTARGQHFITAKWVFDVKVDEMGYVIRFRARLMARGFRQIAGVDFDDTFSTVARLPSFRLLLSFAVHLDWQVWQGGINNAYLNAALKIKQYIKDIEGFPSGAGLYEVNKALYGLRAGQVVQSSWVHPV